MANKPTEEAAQATPSELYAAYRGSSDVRVLTSAELKDLGVTHKDDLRWDASNSKHVLLPRATAEALVEALPLEFSLV